MLFNLKHLGLPRVFDYFSIPEQGDFLVIDYVEGDDLQTLMRRRQSTLTVVEGPVWDRIRLDLNTYGWWWHVQGPTAILDGWLWEDHIQECLP